MKKDNFYINPDWQLVVKCTRDSEPGSNLFSGIVVDPDKDKWEINDESDGWIVGAFVPYNTPALSQEPELNVIL